MKNYKVSYGDFVVKDFGSDKKAAKEFVKVNGGVVFEITSTGATGVADQHGNLRYTYTSEETK